MDNIFKSKCCGKDVRIIYRFNGPNDYYCGKCGNACEVTKQDSVKDKLNKLSEGKHSNWIEKAKQREDNYALAEKIYEKYIGINQEHGYKPTYKEDVMLCMEAYCQLIIKQNDKATTPVLEEIEPSEDIKNIVIEEYKKGNIVISDFEGLHTVPLEEFIKQPVDGMLYDLNRNEAVVLTLIRDPKWVNDYAVSKVIQELKRQIDEK